MSDSASTVRVAVRVRALNSAERAQGRREVVSVRDASLSIGPPSAQKQMTFDCVLGPHVTQADVFEAVGRSMVDACVSGYNGTIFAYGQTGSGKTYTMQGVLDGADEDRGLMPRTFDALFAQLAQTSDATYALRCSYLEIYNEKIADLLTNTDTKLQLRETFEQGVYVEGLSECAVTSAVECLALLAVGAKNRQVRQTAKNEQSSRSHSIFTLHLLATERRGNLQAQRSSRLHLVDLAGSERQKETHTSGQSLKEAANINKALLTLGHVIRGLVDQQAGGMRHIHYRDSKLTYLLRDALGGNSKTSIIATISAASDCFAESLSTLQFAQRAKMIKNEAVINEDETATVGELRDELERLRGQLISERMALLAQEKTELQDVNMTLARLLEEARTADVQKQKEREALEAQLRTLKARHAESQAQLVDMGTHVANYKGAHAREKTRLEERVKTLESDLAQLTQDAQTTGERLLTLTEMLEKEKAQRVRAVSEKVEADRRWADEVHELRRTLGEKEKLSSELQESQRATLEQAAVLQEQLQERQSYVDRLSEEIALAAHEADTLAENLDSVKRELEASQRERTESEAAALERTRAHEAERIALEKALEEQAQTYAQRIESEQALFTQELEALREACSGNERRAQEELEATRAQADAVKNALESELHALKEEGERERAAATLVVKEREVCTERVRQLSASLEEARTILERERCEHDLALAQREENHATAIREKQRELDELDVKLTQREHLHAEAEARRESERIEESRSRDTLQSELESAHELLEECTIELTTLRAALDKSQRHHGELEDVLTAERESAKSLQNDKALLEDENAKLVAVVKELRRKIRESEAREQEMSAQLLSEHEAVQALEETLATTARAFEDQAKQLQESAKQEKAALLTETQATLDAAQTEWREEMAQFQERRESELHALRSALLRAEEEMAKQTSMREASDMVRTQAEEELAQTHEELATMQREHTHIHGLLHEAETRVDALRSEQATAQKHAEQREALLLASASEREEQLRCDKTVLAEALARKDEELLDLRADCAKLADERLQLRELVESSADHHRETLRDMIRQNETLVQTAQELEASLLEAQEERDRMHQRLCEAEHALMDHRTQLAAAKSSQDEARAATDALTAEFAKCNARLQELTKERNEAWHCAEEAATLHGELFAEIKTLQDALEAARIAHSQQEREQHEVLQQARRDADAALSDLQYEWNAKWETTLGQHAAALSDEQTKVAELTRRCTTLDEEHSVARAAYEHEVVELRSELVRLRERADTLEAARAELEHAVRGLEDGDHEKERIHADALHKAERLLEEERGAFESQKEQLLEEFRRLRQQEMDEWNDLHNTRMRDEYEKQAQLRGALEAATTAHSEVSEENARLQHVVAKLTAVAKQFQRKYDETKPRLEEALRTHAAATEALRAKQVECTALQKELESVRNELQEERGRGDRWDNIDERHRQKGLLIEQRVDELQRIVAQSRAECKRLRDEVLASDQTIADLQVTNETLLHENMKLRLRLDANDSEAASTHSEVSNPRAPSALSVLQTLMQSKGENSSPPRTARSRSRGVRRDTKQ